MKRLITLIVIISMLAQPVAATDTVTLTVSVVDSAGNPVGNAEVTATYGSGSSSASTASNGKAFVDVPEGADVEIQIDHEKYMRNLPYKVSDASEREVTIETSKAGSATVRVTDSNGPVQDVHVIVRQNGKIASNGGTNADGEYETGTIEQGDYTVSVREPGYHTKHTEMTVEEHIDKTVEIERGSVSVTFSVKNDYFDSPKAVEEANVQIPDSGTVSTSASGEISISLPVNTNHEVTISKDGYDSITRQIEIKEEQKQFQFMIQRIPDLNVNTVNKQVVVGGQLRVEATNEYDEPVEGATVLVDGDRVGNTGDDGVYMATIEEKGEHTIQVRTEDLDSERITVEGVSSSEKTTKSPQTTTPNEDDDSGGAVSILVKILQGLLDIVSS